MTRFLPEVLPIKGQRIKFYYPGVKILCLRCFKSGHPKWECKQEYKTNWLEYVFKFYKSDEVSDEMLGSWIDTLEQYHPEFQEQKPLWSQKNKDLRDNLKERRETDRNNFTQRGRGHPREKFQHRGIRQISQHQGHYQQPYNTQFMPLGQKYPVAQVPFMNQSYYPERTENPGRSRGRGRGNYRGRGRGKSYNPNLNPSFGNRRGQFYTDVSN